MSKLLLHDEKSGEISIQDKLSEDLSNLLSTGQNSDILFVVREDNRVERIPGHKVILAARSEYFRALLFGGLSETNKTEIELPKTPLKAFKLILNYIYTGKINNLKSIETNVVLDVLSLSNLYGCVELKAEISNYLKNTLNLENACNVLDASLLYELHSLTQSCFLYFDSHASEILRHESFKGLYKDSLCSLLARDSFFASEIKIFEGVKGWIEYNSELDPADLQEVVATVRLPLIELEDLLNVVRQSHLIEPNQLLDAIQLQVNQDKQSSISSKRKLNYRGKVLMLENVATKKYNARVMQEISDGISILDDLDHPYDTEKGYVRHNISSRHNNEGGIIVELSSIFILNHIKLHLWDLDTRSYSYHVELSVDKRHWEKVIDYSNYLCRSWQFLFFERRPVKYIRVVGTHNTSNRIFHLVAIEAMLVQTIPELQDGGIIVPRYNVACTEKSAIVLEGVSRNKNSLLNGNIKTYDYDHGYTCHQLGNGNISIQLGQPAVISSFRLLLWDCEPERVYSFYIETSINQTEWDIVVDKRSERLQSWQSFTFPPKLMSFIRIVGTFNSANEIFHIVHFECPNQHQ